MDNIKDFFSPTSLNKKDVSCNILFEKDETCLYDCIFQPDNIFAKLSSNLLSNKYSTNEKFLKDTQKLTTKFSSVKFNKFDFENSLQLIEMVNNIKNESNFIEKYQYLEITFLKDLNNNSSFLQILSIYNLFSPAINILTPVFLLFLPFILLIFQNQNLSIQNYLDQLFIIFQNNPLGKLFFSNLNISTSQKCTNLFWGFLYVFQIYNSIIYCLKFFKNIKIIHDKISLINRYLIDSLDNFNKLKTLLIPFKTYNEFSNQVEEIISKVNLLLKNINKISEYEVKPSKLIELGDLMKIFYDLHNDEDINNTLVNTYFLNGYIDNLVNLSTLEAEKNINDCKFNKDNKTIIDDNYYPIFLKEEKIKNSIDLCNNIIITGPNASGKTTLIKSFLFNIIFSQQFGKGFYKSANINIFDKFFCYLNIPDTNDRDSLFQAEARICKNIIEYIEENKDEKYLCIFDELYSGTNPDEAVNSSFSLLTYLAEENCKYIITTHFYKLCSLLDKNSEIKNFHMKVITKNDDLKFTYKLEKGISKIKGATNILKKLNYPEKIINNLQLMIDSKF